MGHSYYQLLNQLDATLNLLQNQSLMTVLKSSLWIKYSFIGLLFFMLPMSGSTFQHSPEVVNPVYSKTIPVAFDAALAASFLKESPTKEQAQKVVSPQPTDKAIIPLKPIPNVVIEDVIVMLQESQIEHKGWAIATFKTIPTNSFLTPG